MSVKRTVAFILGLILSVPVFLRTGPALAATALSAGNGAIVLALSGGGMKGLAHIGVLEVLEEAGIQVAGVVGTSMGSIIGGLYAYGYTPREIEIIFRNADIAKLLGDSSLPSLLPEGEEGRVGGQPLVNLQFGPDGKITGPMGGLPGIRLFNFFSDLTAKIGTGNFLDLPVPYAAVATDLETGEMVVLKQGSLAGAMRSSMAIPGVFAPWTQEGRLLVDGGLVANLPVSPARALFPGYPIVAVDVSSGLKRRDEIRTVVDVIDQMTIFMTGQNVAREKAGADLVIHPDTKGVPLLSAESVTEVIDRGRQTARDALPRLLELAAAAPRVKRVAHAAPVINSVEARGIAASRSEQLLGETASWIGSPPDPVLIQKTADRLRQEGDFATVDVSMEEADSGTKLVFNIEKKAPYEMEIGGYTTNVSDAERALTLQAVRRDFAKEGDLLWVALAVGQDWGISARYLTPSRGNDRWEGVLSARQRDVSPVNAASARWERYGLTLYRKSVRGDWRYGLGITLEQLENHGDFDEGFAWGPAFYVGYEGLDDPVDPRTGTQWMLRGWWRNADTLLLRAGGLSVWSISPVWRILLSGGLEVGDDSNPATAAWLGGSDDLLGLGEHPYLADRVAWARVALRRELKRSWWGSTNIDVFGAVGGTFDSGWSNLETPWEAGVSMGIPNNFLEGRFFILYNSESEVIYGFSLGRPIPVRDPLP